MSDKIHLIFFALLVLIFLFRLNQAGVPDYATRFMSTDPYLEEYSDQFVELRSILVERIRYLFNDSDQAGLLSGILIGDKTELSSELKKKLTYTSTIHIAVVSGQNLTLLSGVLMGIAPLLGRKKTILLVSTAILLYACLTGFQVPVIRASIMFLLGSLAQLVGREKESIWIILLTALGMLLYQPLWLYSVSFQLSFLATVGVVVLSPRLERSILFKNLPTFIRQDLVVTLSAWLLTAPIIAANFRQLNLIGILVNSLILFTIAPIMIVGGLVLLVSFIALPLAQLFSVIPQLLLNYFLTVVEFFAALDFGVIKVGQVALVCWLGYYLLIVSLFISLPKSVVLEKLED